MHAWQKEDREGEEKEDKMEEGVGPTDTPPQKGIERERGGGRVT